MDLSVLVVSYGTADLLRECLLSLPQGAEGLQWEAVVVDNASPDGSADMVARDFPHARLARNRENLGYARANNQAVGMARGGALLLLNPDARLKPGAGLRLVRALSERPKAAAVGARITNPDGSLQPSTYPDLSLGLEFLRLARAHLWLPRRASADLFLGSEWDHSQARSVARITGACLLLRRKAWEEVGPLCENFFVYGATHDWCLRARKAGWQVWFTPEAEAVHHAGRSTRAWGDAERHRRMLEAHDLLLRIHRGPAFAAAWWLLDLISAGLALAWAPWRRTSVESLERLRAEARWALGRLLRGGG